MRRETRGKITLDGNWAKTLISANLIENLSSVYGVTKHGQRQRIYGVTNNEWPTYNWDQITNF